MLLGPAAVPLGTDAPPGPSPDPPSGWPSAIEMGQTPMPRDQMFRVDSFWNQRIPAGATVMGDSATYVNSLCAQLDVDPATGNPVPDAFAGNAQVDGAIPCYVVPDGYPLTPVSLFNPDGAVGGHNLEYWITQGVPLPDGWISGASGDKYLNVVQPSTNRAWEFFQMTRMPDGSAKTGWGGYMHDMRMFPGMGLSGDMVDGHPSNYDDWFPSAASMSLLGGILQREEVEAGVCNHPLQMSVGHAGCPPVWPARRCDGFWGAGYPQEGMIYRLRPDIDIDWVWSRFHTNAALTAQETARARDFLRLLTVTLRDFGMYIADQTGTGGCALQLRDYRQVSGYQHSWPEWFGAAWYPLTNLSSYMWAIPWHLTDVLNPIAL